MAMWHTGPGRETHAGPISAWLKRRSEQRRGPTILAWPEHHDPERDGYHESLGAHRPPEDRHRRR
jgi:hypothetical protein